MLLSLACLVASPTGARTDPVPEITLDQDDVVITTRTRVKPGTYRVADTNDDGVVHVRGKGVTVDLTGVTIEGAAADADSSKFTGIGVSIEGGNEIRIVGGAAHGFRVGLRAQASARLHVEGFDGSNGRRDRLKSTPDAEDEGDWLRPHDNDEGQWEARYGAAISIVDCEGVHIGKCSGHHGQNGLLLSECNAATIESSDFSFNSGWGVAMWRSSKCRVVGNACDFCVRGYSHGVYARGQDSAGFLVFEQCSDNLFGGNSATHSGDGFFLYAGEETLKTTGLGGCNRNRVVRNDFSHAVANGIEATFSDGNIFDENVLDDCDHGVWAGYSTNTIVYGNRIRDCANGVSIEHGSYNLIASNAIVRSGTAIHLWWDDDKDLLASVFGKQHPGAPSKWNRVVSNQIDRAHVGIRLDRDYACIVSGNGINNARTAIHVSGDELHPEVFGNMFTRSDDKLKDPVAVRSDGTTRWQLGVNGWSPFPQTLWGAVTIAPVKRGEIVEPPSPPTVVVPPVPAGVSSPSARFAALDRSAIFIDDRGPLDPGATRIVGPSPTSTGAPTIYVRGPGVAFTAESLDPAFTVAPTSGKTPAAIRIRATGNVGPHRAESAKAFVPYAVRVKVGELDETFRGVACALGWHVKFFEWTKDPREDVATYATLVAGAPKDELDVRTLSMRWPGAPTPNVRADRFATVAQTKGTFDAGTYVLHVTSDDGVRVIVYGKTIFEDWTWHGPTDADVSVELSAGEHAIRVEHFELDGFAALSCSIEPVARGR